MRTLSIPANGKLIFIDAYSIIATISNYEKRRVIFLTCLFVSPGVGILQSSPYLACCFRRSLMTCLRFLSGAGMQET